MHKLADIPFTRNMQSAIRTFHPIWSNRRWTELVEKVVSRNESQMATASVIDPHHSMQKKETEISLLQVLDVKAARTFGNWISGLTDFERREEVERAQMRRQQETASAYMSTSSQISPTEDPTSALSRSTSHTRLDGTREQHSSSAFGKVGKSHALPKMSLSGNSALEKRRLSSRIDSAAVRTTGTDTDDVPDSLGLTKGLPQPMDVDNEMNVEITKPELHRAFHNLLKSDPVSPQTHTPLESHDGTKDDEHILETLTTQSTVLIKLRRPHNIWLEMMKTPLPQHPKSTTSSLLIIQAIPRSAREVEMLGLAGNKTAFTNIEGKTSDDVGHVLSPSINMSRVNISHASASTTEASGSAPLATSSDVTVHEAWPFINDGKYPSSGGRMDSNDTLSVETPMADRDDPMTAARPFENEQEDELTRRRKLVSKYYPDSEPMLVGNVDLGQLASLPRKTLEDPTSTESLLLTTDWSKTPLGPLENWPSSLKTAVSIVMAMPNQANLWWNGGNGNKDDLTMVYNDHYASMLQGKHPWMFGKTSAEGWAEVSLPCPFFLLGL